MTGKASRHFAFRPAIILVAWIALVSDSRGQAKVRFVEDVQPILQSKCVACHGPAKAEGGLNLSVPGGIARGGKQGPIVRPHDVDDSLLWLRVESDEMPPKHPLADAEKATLKGWIAQGAAGLPGAASVSNDQHWAFQPLRKPSLPLVRDGEAFGGAIDRFIQQKLEQSAATLLDPASRPTILRRVALSLTGLPPTPQERDAFLADRSPESYERMVEQYLNSPRYAERWAKFWLDGAGYADSNGYFNADSDRPLAYKYRDYVIRSFGEDKPFDRFLVEQLAGDELAMYQPGAPATPEQVELLTATHFLRNGQDGTGESDGNPDERRIDRYTALESCQQIIGTSILGLTIQCAKCHSHKFEPITHEDYYRLQAILYPAFPAAHPDLWVKPQDRIILAPSESESRSTREELRRIDSQLSTLRSEVRAWSVQNRPRGEVLFRDEFDTQSTLSQLWTNKAPGDDQPGGKPPVSVGGRTAPAARSHAGHLQIHSAETLDSWVVTRQIFDWTPEVEGEAIQVTFDLVDNRLNPGGQPAERLGYFLAAHDFDDSSMVKGGNILVDGHPDGPSSVQVDYPGPDARSVNSIGASGYRPGRNYGIRVTKTGIGKFRLEHLVDGVPESNTITLNAEDLPDGAFGFEYHRDRSFVVDRVIVERIPARLSPAFASFAKDRAERSKRLEALETRKKELEKNPPGRIAWVGDRSGTPPETKLLLRGDYGKPGASQPPAPPAVLTSRSVVFGAAAATRPTTSRRRLDFARWLTDPRERAAGLVARVQVNRIWQGHFGEGIAATSENLGMSGSPPTHPELIDWLAYEFVYSGWSIKHVHRLILGSRTFRQTSEVPANSPKYSGFPARRLEAETIRDAMLSVTGELETTQGGPYVAFQSRDSGAVEIAEDSAGSKRRSIYLQNRRSQVISLLQVFDSPSIVYNSIRRGRTAMPLQSLTLLNSQFTRARAAAFASRLTREAMGPADRTDRSFLLAFGRTATPEERAKSVAFVAAQEKAYAPRPDAADRAWTDFCQALLISNEFLYID